MSADHASRVATGTTEWAAELLVDGLEPDGHTLQLGAQGPNDGDPNMPFARMHFAFHPTATPDERDRFVVELAKVLTDGMQPAVPAAITAETARHVLWHYGRPEGYRPGSFTQKLMQTIDAADVVHTARLRTAYPELVDAMFLAANERDGIARLTALANGKEA